MLDPKRRAERQFSAVPGSLGLSGQEKAKVERMSGLRMQVKHENSWMIHDTRDCMHDHHVMLVSHYTELNSVDRDYGFLLNFACRVRWRFDHVKLVWTTFDNELPASGQCGLVEKRRPGEREKS
jgi:hypothetical protein